MQLTTTCRLWLTRKRLFSLSSFMKDFNSAHSPASAQSALPPGRGESPWQRLKSQRISYLTLPLLIMATVVEFVILATGWKYQQTVCLPQGMGVTFFGIGPIGATILAVELLKLPLAIWTASRSGWLKGAMSCMGLPLICVLTFQLVKDMAVYEMGIAMTPASQLLEQASTEEIKIAQLNGELTAIEQKKADRENKLAEFAAKKSKAKAELDDLLKRNMDVRQDAISLTDYQKKELSEVDSRQSTIIQQFNADTAQLTKSISELRASREIELGRATKWNAEEARIENAYKAKMFDYTNKKAAYEKDLADYNGANFLKRQLMKEPVNPGVPPERESNTILKPTLVGEIDAQIKAKEAELSAVNTKRRDRVAQVDADARQLREEFDRRSGTKRAETDRKREELSVAYAALTAALAVEEKQLDLELAAAVQKVDGIRAEVDAARKKAESFYEAREGAIRNTQVHRIATTVEIVRGLLKGERPMSIKATAKERGDILTDQISMVRIWVYPVLAFIVAFLPTLMVEIGFSTLFHREEHRPPHRLGLFGRRLHWLYKRAGRQKILRAERLAREAATEIAARDAALGAAHANAEKALAAKEVELQAAHEASTAAAAAHEHHLKKQEVEWVAKFTGLAESLNRAVVEKDALQDFQKTEIERQVQLRQNAWADRLNRLRQELDDQRTANESDRATLLQEQHQKLLAVSEDCKTQVIQIRRQLADAELAAVETSAKLGQDLKAALAARDVAVAQLQQQTDVLSLKLSQTKEDAAREIEKAARQEKHRFERQQLEFGKTLRQREEDFEHQLKQREHELSLEFETRLTEEQARMEKDSRRREEEQDRQLEARARELEARWNQEVQQREDAALVRLKQREQQLQAQAEVRLSDLKTQAEQELRRRESELERQLDAQVREADTRLKQELQQKELNFQARLKQREQELTARAEARETDLQDQLTADLRAREEELAGQAEASVRATETRLGHEAQKKEELFQSKLRQREQQLQAQFEARQAELQVKWSQDLKAQQQEWERDAGATARAAESRWTAELQQQEELFQAKVRQRDQHWQLKVDDLRAASQVETEQALRRREVETADAGQRALRELETQLRKEMQQKDEAAQAKARQREQELLAQLTAQGEAHQLAAQKRELELQTLRVNFQPVEALLANTERERDEARQSAAEARRQVQEFEGKLMEASSLLTGWTNGKNVVSARGGKDAFQVMRGGLGTPGEQ